MSRYPGIILKKSPDGIDPSSPGRTVRADIRLDVRADIRLDVRADIRLDVRADIRLDIRRNHGCPCRIIRATTDIHSKLRALIFIAPITKRISMRITVVRI